MALVTYSSIFHASPVGAAVPAGVDATSAPDLQSIAWNFVRTYYENPAPGEHTMEECRGFISGNVCASFWTLLGEPNEIASCQSHFENADAEQNPFRWPDPQLKLWPAP